MKAFKRTIGIAIALIIGLPLAVVMVSALVVLWPIVIALALVGLGALILIDGNRPAL